MGEKMRNHTPYYLGATPDINFEKNAVIALNNPSCSGVNLYLDQSSVCNLSKELCRLEFYTGKCEMDGLNKSVGIQGSNLEEIKEQEPRGEIFYGKNCNLVHDISWRTVTLREYETMQLGQSNIIVIPPGTNYYYIITPLVGLKRTNINVAFSWWEEER